MVKVAAAGPPSNLLLAVLSAALVYDIVKWRISSPEIKTFLITLCKLILMK